MINIKANWQYAVNLSRMLRNWRFLGVNKIFGRNDKGRGNTEEHKEKKDFTISYDKVFTENIFD
jgi:hypothetical protein